MLQRKVFGLYGQVLGLGLEGLVLVDISDSLLSSVHRLARTGDRRCG